MTVSHSLTRILLSLALGATAQVALAADAAGTSPEVSRVVEDAVVKVFSTIRHPDASKPWAKLGPQDATGSGVIIKDHYILTNAHVVEYASQVEVQANEAGDKLSASVVAVAPGIDLALLKLDDDSFFAKRRPLECAASIPDVKDTVMTYGYPTGGSNQSITKGIISRIEFVPYRAPVSGLRIQIDAAINPGNSGGAAVVGNKLIGITFSSLVGSGVQSIGYIIPCEEIDLFLKHALKNEPYTKPALYDDMQTLENPALRTYLKLDPGVEGMVISEPAVGSPLKQWDILNRIGDAHIDDQGMVSVRPGLRVRFQYLIQKQAKDGKVTLGVIRDGKQLTMAVPAPENHPMLVQDLMGAYPRYFVYGPLVFGVATQQFVGSHSNQLAMGFYLGSPLAGRIGAPPGFDGEELVVVAAPFLPHKLDKGYSSPVGEVVDAINGVKVKNLAGLVEILRDSKDEYLVFTFQQRSGEDLVFKRTEMVAATEDLLTDNGIRAQGSADLMSIWTAKP